ncbi:MAG: hypothetical protein AAB631_01865 [Patescibacteria group bacterium]
MKPKNNLPLYTSTFVLLFLHFGGVIFHWYNTFYSFDKIVHVAGGFWIAQIILLLSTKHQTVAFPKDKFMRACILLISMAVLVGVFWEFFEVFVGKISILRYGTGIENHLAPTDTAFDLFFDFLGATLAAIIFLPKKNGSTSSSGE